MKETKLRLPFLYLVDISFEKSNYSQILLKYLKRLLLSHLKLSQPSVKKLECEPVIITKTKKEKNILVHPLILRSWLAVYSIFLFISPLSINVYLAFLCLFFLICPSISLSPLSLFLLFLDYLSLLISILLSVCFFICLCLKYYWLSTQKYISVSYLINLFVPMFSFFTKCILIFICIHSFFSTLVFRLFLCRLKIERCK